MDDLILLCTREAAAALGVDRMTVLRLVWAGRLKAIRIGTGRTNAWAFREEDLTHYAHTHGRPIDLAAGLALAVPSGGGPHTLPKGQEPLFPLDPPRPKETP